MIPYFVSYLKKKLKSFILKLLQYLNCYYLNKYLIIVDLFYIILLGNLQFREESNRTEVGPISDVKEIAKLLEIEYDALDAVLCRKGTKIIEELGTFMVFYFPYLFFYFTCLSCHVINFIIILFYFRPKSIAMQ